MKRKSLLLTIAMTVLMAVSTPLTAMAADNNDDYLHTDGSKILDANGKEVRLTGIAWFGNETPNYGFHGLWANTYQNLLNIVADNGFNILRVPLSVELVNKWRTGEPPMSDSINDYIAPDLKGKNSLDIMDLVVSYCKKVGLKVMFDMHRVESGGQTNTWFTSKYSTDDYEKCWEFIAERYKNDDTVIAADLFNEPHGKAYRKEQCAKWDDSTDETNWKYEVEKVSKKILEVNPNLLVVVEGVETYPREGYTYSDSGEHAYYGGWWGGNLRGVKDYPVDLGVNTNKVIYSPHDYGPTVSAQSWFEGDFTTETLTRDCWGPSWLYIAKQNIAPILIGEWGAILDGGKNQAWFEDLAELIEENNLNHTFWCLNPNSGDTEGILGYDFATIDQKKLDIVKPTLWQDENGKYIGLDHKVNLGANGTHVMGDVNVPDNPTPEPNPVPDVNVLLGDIDNNGKINVKDLLTLRQYVAGEDIEINEKAADVNGDGTINMLDYVQLKLYLSKAITSFQSNTK